MGAKPYGYLFFFFPTAIKSCSLGRAVLLAWISAISALFPSHLVSLAADSQKSS